MDEKIKSQRTLDELSDPKAYDNMIIAAGMLTNDSLHDWYYQVEDCYLDYGSRWLWTTIICYGDRGETHQVLNPKQWLDLVNAESEEEVRKIVTEIQGGEYFQDRDRSVKEDYDVYRAVDNDPDVLECQATVDTIEEAEEKVNEINVEYGEDAYILDNDTGEFIGGDPSDQSSDEEEYYDWYEDYESHPLVDAYNTACDELDVWPEGSTQGRMGIINFYDNKTDETKYSVEFEDEIDFMNELNPADDERSNIDMIKAFISSHNKELDESIESDFSDCTNMSDAKNILKKYDIELIKKDNRNYILKKGERKYTFYVLDNPNEVRADLIKAVTKLNESEEGDQIAQDYIDSKNANYEADKQTTRDMRTELAKQGIATDEKGKPFTEDIEIPDGVEDAGRSQFGDRQFKYKGFTIAHFPYDMKYGDKTDHFESFIIESPAVLKSGYHLPLYCEDENGEVINFLSLEAAKMWIDNFKDKFKLEVKHGNEIHAVIKDEYKNESLEESEEQLVNGYKVFKLDTTNRWFVFDGTGYKCSPKGYETKEEAIEKATSLEKGKATSLEEAVDFDIKTKLVNAVIEAIDDLKYVNIDEYESLASFVDPVMQLLDQYDTTGEYDEIDTILMHSDLEQYEDGVSIKHVRNVLMNGLIRLYKDLTR